PNHLHRRPSECGSLTHAVRRLPLLASGFPCRCHSSGTPSHTGQVKLSNQIGGPPHPSTSIEPLPTPRASIRLSATAPPADAMRGSAAHRPVVPPLFVTTRLARGPTGCLVEAPALRPPALPALCPRLCPSGPLGRPAPSRHCRPPSARSPASRQLPQ